MPISQVAMRQKITLLPEPVLGLREEVREWQLLGLLCYWR